MRKRRTRRDMIPTPSELGAVRRGIQKTAVRLNQRLSRESIEDLMQEVLLRLWRSGAESKLRDCPAYVGRVVTSTLIDMVREQSAQKRKGVTTLDPGTRLHRRTRTPEEILLAREEALGVLKKNYALRSRVNTAVRCLNRRVPLGSVGGASGLSRM